MDNTLRILETDEIDLNHGNRFEKLRILSTQGSLKLFGLLGDYIRKVIEKRETVLMGGTQPHPQSNLPASYNEKNAFISADQTRHWTTCKRGIYVKSYCFFETIS